MDNKDFLQEALSCPNCPKDFEKEYNAFLKFQKLTSDTLNEFARICDLGKIKYHLTFGTLLGMIRDKGPMPWDYDVDVFVHFEDREKMWEALDSYLSSDYIYTTGEKQKVKQFFTRVAPKGYDTNSLHVDVFYYGGLPDDEEEIEIYSQKQRELIIARDSKISLPIHCTSQYRKLLIKYGIKYLFTPYKKIVGEITKGFSKYDSRISPKWANCNSNFGKYVFSTDLIRETTTITIYGNVYKIPEQYDAFLKENYGNYLVYPPIEERIKEVMIYSKHLQKHAKLK